MGAGGEEEGKESSLWLYRKRLIDSVIRSVWHISLRNTAVFARVYSPKTGLIPPWTSLISWGNTNPEFTSYLCRVVKWSLRSAHSPPSQNRR
jgi:hypothetical protein